MINRIETSRVWLEKVEYYLTVLNIRPNKEGIYLSTNSNSINKRLIITSI